MSLQNTPAAERPHIAFFGVRNAGKSSLANAVTGQNLSVVSDVEGTTTDPVRKTMELLPLGPVVIIDTPGIDDVGELGEERVRRAKRVLDQTDIAVLVVAADVGIQDADRELIALFEDRKIPYLIANNKTDLLKKDSEVAESPAPSPAVAGPRDADAEPQRGRGLGAGAAEAPFGEEAVSPATALLPVSAKTGEGIYELKEAIARLVKDAGTNWPLVSDLVSPGDLVVLVIPIDKSAPKGRLILPQQMVMRDLLDTGAQPLLVRDTEYPSLLSRLLSYSSDTGSSLSAADSDCIPLRPALVVTDSQVFGAVSKATPDVIPLTSFSILMARYRAHLHRPSKAQKK